LLGSSVVSPSLQPNVVGSVALNDSLEWKSGSDVEWSIDVESEFIIHSLGSNFFSFVKIDNLPLLMSSSVVTPYTYSLAFLVFTSFDVKDFTTLPIDELVVLILEHLEPS